MTSTAGTRTHTCVFFDDGEIELVCACGERALYVADDDGGIVVVLHREPSPVTRLHRATEVFAVSA